MGYTELETRVQKAQGAAAELLSRIPKRNEQTTLVSKDIVEEIVRKAIETSNTGKGAALVVKKELFLYLMRNSPATALEIEREWYKRKGISFSDNEFNNIALNTKQTFIGPGGVIDQKAAELAYREASVELRKLASLRTKPKPEKIQKEQKPQQEKEESIVKIISNPYLIISKVEQKGKEIARKAPQIISKKEQELDEQIVRTIPKEYKNAVEFYMRQLRDEHATLEQQELFLKFVQNSKNDSNKIPVSFSIIGYTINVPAPIGYLFAYINKRDFNPQMLELLPAIAQLTMEGNKYLNRYGRFEICLKFAELAAKKKEGLDKENVQKLMKETVGICDKILSGGRLDAFYLHQLSNLVGKMNDTEQLQKFLLPALDYVSKKSFLTKEEMVAVLHNYFGKKLDDAKVKEFEEKIREIEDKFIKVVNNETIKRNYDKADELVRKLNIKRDGETVVNFAYAIAVLGERKTAELHGKNGIIYFARYSPKMLEEAYANLDQKRKSDKPILVIAYNKNDWNGAFYAGVGTNMQDLTKNYKVIIYEVEGEQRFYEKLLYTNLNYGKINTIIIGGHGSSDRIQMGLPTDEGSIDLGDKINLSMVSDIFDRKGGRPKVILVSCSTGKDENAIGGLISRTWGADLEAPKIPANIKRFNLAMNGEIKSVTYEFSSSARFLGGKEMKANWLENALSSYGGLITESYVSVKEKIAGTD